MDPVALVLDGGIARIEFGDPASRNLLTVALLDALPRVLAEAEGRGARVVVLRGRGDVWSAGYEIAEIPADLFDPDPGAGLDHPFARCMRAVEECPLPTIAAVHGHAIGGGVELAVSCDLRLLRAGSKLGVPAATLGLVYPLPGLAKFTRLLGPAAARRLLFTGDPVDAAEAERIGLVNRSLAPADFDPEVEALARRIASAAPIAVRGMKAALRLLERGAPLSDAELATLAAGRHESFHSEDAREGRRAFAEKRPPRFTGR